MYEWFLWDFDGTLFDSYPLVVRAMQDSLAVFGESDSYDNILRALKKTMGYAVRHYTALTGHPELGAEFYRREQEAMQQNKPFPEAETLCRKIQASGCHNLLYTHRDKLALTMLSRCEMLPLFDGFVTSEDGFPGKPAPDGIQYLLNKYHIPPEAAIMIGDRPIDAQAGINAGIAGCLWDAEDLFPEYSGWKIRSLEELNDFIPQK